MLYSSAQSGKLRLAIDIDLSRSGQNSRSRDKTYDVVAAFRLRGSVSVTAFTHLGCPYPLLSPTVNTSSPYFGSQLVSMADGDSVRQRIISSVFAAKLVEESYVAHIKIWEEDGTDEGGKKPRYIIISSEPPSILLMFSCMKVCM